ncbi:MAG: biopolymer transporter ExbD [Planctomycetota bacterium]|jgi:biopolymer transport protein ExbD|nr:biopolymer transporter ExbD [Planctomycetia bacterium]RLT05340.1 MAG: biopolymer transporter ExbD [Planctomycetota bacterium]
MARRESKLADKIAIDMTPMIDVVFQLMSFFMCTLKVVTPEGDFNVRMPMAAAAAAAPDDQQVPPVRVKLSAGADGSLASIAMNGSAVADFEELRRKVISLVGTDTGPNSLAEKTEVELDCDYSLKYANVVRAITAVSGKVQGGQIVELIKKIKFTPPKKGGS